MTDNTGCKLLNTASWSDHRRLNRIPTRHFEKGGWLKRKWWIKYKNLSEPITSCSVHRHVEKWDRLGSLTINVTSAMMTRHQWGGSFINCSQETRWRVPTSTIKGQVSKESLQVGGYRQLFDIDKDGLRQVYLNKIRYP